jgi:hypothetical protein
MKSHPPIPVNTNPFNSTHSRAILLIEPRQPRLTDCLSNLGDSRFTVFALHDAKAIYLMSGSIKPPCAVLSDEVGPVALQASAEAVRWQWPKARIVILGKPGELEDHLYDDIVARTTDTDHFLATLERITESMNRDCSDSRY